MPTPLHDTIHLSSEVVPTHVQLAEENDLRQFLDFIARDMTSHPERFQAFDAGFVQRLQALTENILLDLDDPLSVDDE